jgi:hypothetical protein
MTMALLLEPAFDNWVRAAERFGHLDSSRCQGSGLEESSALNSKASGLRAARAKPGRFEEMTRLDLYTSPSG